MQGSRLDFMKRKEAKHTAERVGGKGEQQQEKRRRRRRRAREGGGGGGVDVGWNNLTRGCLLAHRYATDTLLNVSPAVCSSGSISAESEAKI